jgi:oligosaccharyltransferase complex subunit alpha (ribophorin I)
VKGKTVDVEVETVYTHYIEPFPTEISQKDKQLVKYVGSHYLFSPYKVVKQTTKVTLASKNVESFTKLKPFSQSDNVLTFGP